MANNSQSNHMEIKLTRDEVQEITRLVAQRHLVPGAALDENLFVRTAKFSDGYAASVVVSNMENGPRLAVLLLNPQGTAVDAFDPHNLGDDELAFLDTEYALGDSVNGIHMLSLAAAAECLVWTCRDETITDPTEVTYYAARQALIIHLAQQVGLKTGVYKCGGSLDMYVAGTKEHISTFLETLHEAHGISGLTVDVASEDIAFSLEDTFGTAFTFEVGDTESIAQL